MIPNYEQMAKNLKDYRYRPPSQLNSVVRSHDANRQPNVFGALGRDCRSSLSYPVVKELTDEQVDELLKTAEPLAQDLVRGVKAWRCSNGDILVVTDKEGARENKLAQQR